MKMSELTRRMNLLAGSRPPLPGHYNTREASLRTELVECFEPVNTMELLWVADIAYCTAAIELCRAQIAGFRMHMFRQAFENEFKSETVPGFPEFNRVSMFSPDEQADLARFAAQNFEARKDDDMLSETSFAMLLGVMSGHNVQQLRLLQQLLHDETRERDRLVNQIDRRRRQAMRDAIEVAEAKQRAAEYEEHHKAREDQGDAAAIAGSAVSASPEDGGQADKAA